MANTKLQILRSTGSGHIPSAGQLDYGQLAILYHTQSSGAPDGRVFYKDSNGNVQVVSGTGGGGGNGNISSGTMGQVAIYDNQYNVLSGSTNLFVSAAYNQVHVSGTLVIRPSSSITAEYYDYIMPAFSASVTGGNSYPISGQILTIGTIPSGSPVTLLPTASWTQGSGSYGANNATGSTIIWSSNAFQYVGMSLVLALNTTQSISRIAWARVASDSPTALNVQTSIDGINYITQESVGDVVSYTSSFNPVHATTVRLTITTAKGANYWGLKQLNISRPDGIRLAWTTVSASVVSSSYSTTASYATVAQSVLGFITSASYALTASYANTAISAAYAPMGSGIAGQIALYSSTQGIAGTPVITVSSNMPVLSGSKTQITGNLDVSGSTIFRALPYVWPLGYGVSGTFLSQDGNGNLAWGFASGSSGVGLAGISIQRNGIITSSAITTINFTGSAIQSVIITGVTASITIATGSGGGSGNAFIYALLFG